MDDDGVPLKHRRKPSICISCCFRNNHNNHEHIIPSPSPSPSPDFNNHFKSFRSTLKSPTSWLKSRVNHHNSRPHHEFPEFKEKCKNLMSKMGRNRRHSADFRYDSISYALNFDEGVSDDTHPDYYQDQFPMRNFSSRLPASPPDTPTAKKSSSASSNSFNSTPFNSFNIPILT
ncbi:hypothetical protein MKX03_024677 [Papaver bracteatum]|nr:hypothetical protein MKX03_024677 [Papaver bracteatum]